MSYILIAIIMIGPMQGNSYVIDHSITYQDCITMKSSLEPNPVVKYKCEGER